MKKLSALLLTLLLLLNLSFACGAEVCLSNQALEVDGRSVDCEKYNIDGRNYFKLRDLAQLLNGTGSQFDVDYDKARNAMIVTTGVPYTHPNGTELKTGADNSASAQVTAQKLIIDGKERSDLTIYNIGDVNFFQLREMGEALGFAVDYREADRTMVVRSGPAPAAVTARLEETEDAGREYLDKLVFLGDSTTYGIGYYYRHGYTDLVPPSQVWTPKNGTMTLSYYATTKLYVGGEELLIADAAKKYKPEILVITLGVNGISFMDEEWFVRDYTALVKSIQTASPDTRIILNSIYPVADSYQYQKSINNKKINAANGWIETMAQDLGLRFLYSFEALAVEGKLPESCQNGDGMHLTGEAFGKVMTYIRTHALPET